MTSIEWKIKDEIKLKVPKENVKTFRKHVWEGIFLKENLE